MQCRFLKLIDSFAERNGDNQVQSLIMSIYNFAMSFPNPEKWLNESADAFLVDDDFDFTSSKWGRIVISKFNYVYIQLCNVVSKS